jgi:hypothetical protein
MLRTAVPQLAHGAQSQSCVTFFTTSSHTKGLWTSLDQEARAGLNSTNSFLLSLASYLNLFIYKVGIITLSTSENLEG